jgi:hypothetical protein
MLAQVVCPGGGNGNAGAAFGRRRDEAIHSFLHASLCVIGALPGLRFSVLAPRGTGTK